VRDQMAGIGFAGGKLAFIAMLEIVSAALYLWPRTRSVGLLMVSSYLGGAICAHVQHNEFVKALSPSLLLLLACTGTGLSHPQVLWSLDHPRYRSSRKQTLPNLVTSQAKS